MLSGGQLFSRFNETCMFVSTCASRLRLEVSLITHHPVPFEGITPSSDAGVDPLLAATALCAAVQIVPWRMCLLLWLMPFLNSVGVMVVLLYNSTEQK